MGNRIIITEEEKNNIEKMYNLNSENDFIGNIKKSLSGVDYGEDELNYVICNTPSNIMDEMGLSFLSNHMDKINTLGINQLKDIIHELKKNDMVNEQTTQTTNIPHIGQVDMDHSDVRNTLVSMSIFFMSVLIDKIVKMIKRGNNDLNTFCKKVKYKNPVK